MSQPSAETESLSLLMWQLLLALARLLLPLLLVAILPLSWGLLLEALLLAVLLLSGRRWPAVGRQLSALLCGCVLGTAFAIGRCIASDWSILLSVLWVLLALAGIGSLERHLGLKVEEEGNLRAEHDPHAGEAGHSAWGGEEPRHTPEGQAIRYLSWGEIAMGGPVYVDCLMPDGVLLEGIGSGSCFSDDGRYFLAPLPSRNAWGLLLLDRQQRCVYRCQPEQTPWQISGCDGQWIRGQYSPLGANQAVQLALDEVLARAQCVALVAIADLWLDPRWQAQLDNAPRRWPGMPSGLAAHGRPFLPESLQALEDPLRPLRYPEYQLWLGEQATGLLLGEDASPCWDGQWLACQARSLEQPEAAWSYWLGAPQQPWRDLGRPQLAEQERLALYPGAIRGIENGQLWIDVELGSPLPNRGEYGEQLSDYLSTVETKRGHDAWGRIRPGECAPTCLEVLWPGDGQRQRLRSQVLSGQRHLLFDEVAREQGWPAYALSLDGQVVQGQWQLEHRLSSDQRWVALLPACAAPALAEQVQVLELASGRLLASPPLLVERLRDFHDGVLEVVTLQGLCSEGFQPHPLYMADQPAPPAGEAARYYLERGYGRACHRLQRLHCRDEGLQLQAEWRLVSRPQAVNADGDFILPAPGGQDAAWLRGCETEYPDNWLREQCARRDGYVLTASGCALFGVTPSMAWDASGRYLLLTHQRGWDDPHNDDPNHSRQWLLWLLDTQQRSLRRRPGSIGGMPRIDKTDAQGWQVRVFEADWDCPEDAGTVCRVSLEELLALPAEQLELRGERWHLPGEQRPVQHWQAFELAQLAAWRR